MMISRRVALAVLSMICPSLLGFGSTQTSREPSGAQVEHMTAHNERASTTWQRSAVVVTRPFVEYEEAGYLIFSDDTSYPDSANLKAMLVKHAPESVKVVVLATRNSSSHFGNLRRLYGQYVGEDRLKIVYVPDAPFWVRDGLPYPVHVDEDGSTLGLTDAQYYGGFDGDSHIAQYFGAPTLKHEFFFEGGNFLTNSRGDCFVVNNDRVKKIPDAVFLDYYGCASLARMRWLGGIGHVDERIKFLSDTVAVTDKPEFVEELQQRGYEVFLLPRPNGAYQSYVNALMINGTIFVPAFGHANDRVALDIFRNYGTSVVAINTAILSNNHRGSIHCTTMTFPPASLAVLLNAFGGQEVD